MHLKLQEKTRQRAGAGRGHPVHRVRRVLVPGDDLLPSPQRPRQPAEGADSGRRRRRCGT